jgi:peroxiredoxin
MSRKIAPRLTVMVLCTLAVGATYANHASEQTETISSQTTDTSPSASRAARYREIVAEYEAHLKVLVSAVQKGTDNTEATDIYERLSASVGQCATRLMDLAKENPGDATAREALIWILHNTSRYRNDQRLVDLGQQASQGLLNDHADHLDVAQAALQLGNLVSSDRDAFLTGLAEQSHDRETQGLARIALARYLMTKIGIAESCQVRGWDGIMTGKAFGPSYVAHLHACNRTDMREKITNLLEQVVAETGDIPYVRYKMPRESELRRNMTQGKVAAELLDEFIHLAIGEPSPDIEGVDLDGNPLKLADYRGKVVVLVFWATWCGSCMAAIPHERELVERLKDRPFVLLGINCDEDQAAARKAIESEKITWRNWSDPLDTSKLDMGPIVKRFHVHSFPSVLVLDADGIIRNKQVAGQSLDTAIAKLLEELGQTAAK